MKLQMKATTMIKVLATFPLLSLAACVETTTPLCNDANKIDVPGLDRTYSVATMMDPSSGLSETQFTLEHVGRGEYRTVKTKDSEPSTVSICKIGNWTVSETPTKFGTYEPSILAADGQLLSFNLLLLDPKALASAGVSYEIVDRPSSSVPNRFRGFLAQASGQQSTFKSLVVKTEDPAARQAIGQLAKPNFLAITAY